MRFFSALTVLSLGFLQISCLQKEGDQPSGQIVVIGNGADAKETLVVDVQRDQRVQSHLLTDKAKLEPVIQYVDSAVLPARLNWIVSDWATGLKVAQLESSTLESNGSVQESTVALKSSDEVSRGERRVDLENLHLSRDIRPLFLSNGGMIYVNRAKDLCYTADKRICRKVAGSVSAFFVDDLGRLVFSSKPAEWKVADLKAIDEANRDLSVSDVESLKTFKADHLFLGRDQKIYAFLVNQRGGLTDGLPLSSLYRMNESMAFEKVKEEPKAFAILEVKPSVGVESGDSVMAKIVRVNELRPNWALLFLAGKQIEIWPSTETLSESSEVRVGKRAVIIRPERTSAKLEVCGFESDEKLYCQNLQLEFAPKQMVLGYDDELFVSRPLKQKERSRGFVDPDQFDPASQVSAVQKLQILGQDGTFGKELAYVDVVGDVESMRFFSDSKR